MRFLMSPFFWMSAFFWWRNGAMAQWRNQSGRGAMEGSSLKK